MSALDMVEKIITRFKGNILSSYSFGSFFESFADREITDNNNEQLLKE